MDASHFDHKGVHTLQHAICTCSCMWVLYGVKCANKFAVQDMLDLHAASCLTLHTVILHFRMYVYMYIRTYVIVSGELRTCEQQNQ